MTKYELKVEMFWEMEADTPEDAMDKLADHIAYNNETVETLFWDGMEVTEVK